MLGATCSPCCQLPPCVRPHPSPFTVAYQILDGMDGSWPARQAGPGVAFFPGFPGYGPSNQINYISAARGSYHRPPEDEFGGFTEQSSYPDDPVPNDPLVATFAIPRLSATCLTDWSGVFPLSGEFRARFFVRFFLQLGALRFYVEQECLCLRNWNGVTSLNRVTTLVNLYGGYGYPEDVGAATVFGQTLGFGQSATTTATSPSEIPLTLYARGRVYTRPDGSIQHQDVKIAFLGVVNSSLQDVLSPPFGTAQTNFPA